MTRLIYDIEGWEIKRVTVCEKGSQLRPHIVWFGEAVPMMDVALDITQEADIFIVVGTSLNVYPAAGLVYAVEPGTQSTSWTRIAPHAQKTERNVHRRTRHRGSDPTGGAATTALATVALGSLI